MPRRGLKNVTRIETVQLGKPSWKLETKSGTPIPAFSHFCESFLGNPFSTRKRYAEVVSRFIDYLYEVGVFDGPVRAAHINAAITAYPILLVDGSKALATRVRKGDADLWLADAAEALDWAPLKSTSLCNTLAPVNKFLRLSENLAREAHEHALFLGLTVSEGPVALIEAVSGRETVGGLQVAAIKQNSMFGNVAKFATKGIKRARGLSSAGAGSRSPKRDRDFPREALAELIRRATSWRDKTLWLMLAALGIRTSEALNLLLADIDLEGQRIFILDPHERHAQMSGDDQNRLRFKGRQVVYTYAIPELKSELFYAIQKYLELEYVPSSEPGEPNYFFQYVEGTRRGRPYVDVSAEALRKNFQRACKAAQVPLPFGAASSVLHSLRHMYGVYLVNDFPVNASQGLFGLSLVDVQLMMGHANVKTTAKYARPKRRRIEARLQASDEAMLNMSAEELRALPGFNVRLLQARK